MLNNPELTSVPPVLEAVLLLPTDFAASLTTQKLLFEHGPLCSSSSFVITATSHQ